MRCCNRIFYLEILDAAEQPVAAGERVKPRCAAVAILPAAAAYRTGDQPRLAQYCVHQDAQGDVAVQYIGLLVEPTQVREVVECVRPRWRIRVEPRSNFGDKVLQYTSVCLARWCEFAPACGCVRIPIAAECIDGLASDPPLRQCDGSPKMRSYVMSTGSIRCTKRAELT